VNVVICILPVKVYQAQVSITLSYALLFNYFYI